MDDGSSSSSSSSDGWSLKLDDLLAFRLELPLRTN